MVVLFLSGSLTVRFESITPNNNYTFQLFCCRDESTGSATRSLEDSRDMTSYVERACHRVSIVISPI